MDLVFLDENSSEIREEEHIGEIQYENVVEAEVYISNSASIIDIYISDNMRNIIDLSAQDNIKKKNSVSISQDFSQNFVIDGNFIMDVEIDIISSDLHPLND